MYAVFEPAVGERPEKGVGIIETATISNLVAADVKDEVFGWRCHHRRDLKLSFEDDTGIVVLLTNCAISPSTIAGKAGQRA